MTEPGLSMASRHLLVERTHLPPKEIAPGHELHGLAPSAVAKCEGCDDVVFRASDDTFAIVHLAWTLKPETPLWPRTTRLGGFIVVEAAMDQQAH
ncbi:hypothetical protein EV644_101504 [Kribbella orskensis]|uniref:Uncharacterized protein n=1 Tax=Kribbella orskensis TaxID=2512216 RepID=A0ABY2BUA1_9ACTN|nr:MULTISPECIES: hypothetical protein [Kribbella]TCN44361.1 hypothetical protein EV642_101485 [Kribbella sp. VKM Ac-2500]TCO31861.1 hypothetical protein EV644_101504 [Kribbella orskensis]